MLMKVLSGTPARLQLALVLEPEDAKGTLKELSPTASDPRTVSFACGLETPTPTFWACTLAAPTTKARQRTPKTVSMIFSISVLNYPPCSSG
jgi:hypothetical protein